MSKITEVQKNYMRENYHFYSIGVPWLGMWLETFYRPTNWTCFFFFLPSLSTHHTINSMKWEPQKSSDPSTKKRKKEKKKGLCEGAVSGFLFEDYGLWPLVSDRESIRSYTLD